MVAFLLTVSTSLKLRVAGENARSHRRFLSVFSSLSTISVAITAFTVNLVEEVETVRKVSLVNQRNVLSESLQLGISLVNNVAKFVVFSLHEHIPCKIYRVLFEHRLLLVTNGDGSFLLDKLGIRYSCMICIVNESTEHTSKLLQDQKRFAK